MVLKEAKNCLNYDSEDIFEIGIPEKQFLEKF